MNDNRTLVETILKGDTDAFRILIRDHQRLVSHIVCRMVKNREDVEDVCQEVFLKIHRSLKDFKFNSQLSTWVAAIAFNTAVSHLQKGKGEPSLVSEDDATESSMAISEDAGPDRLSERASLSNFLQAEIDRLPPLFGTIIALFHLHEMSYQEIGNIMRLPEGTVKSYLFRGRRLLKQRLTARIPQEDLCL
ncbi:RNA polymerase, sigma-24 subunit, ECF subfamily [Candidatus Zixiibacteriota bacterium]|nr:RNA polymerase, sigma-24 subunit, ECF subfamily [candidate division Zixibacteria bacterium]